MGKMTVTIEISLPDALAAPLKRVVEVDIKADPLLSVEGSVLINEMIWDLNAELLVGTHLRALPSVPNLSEPSKRPIAVVGPEDLISSWNGDGVWQEIHNSYLTAAHCFATARAYKDVEPKDASLEEAYYCHSKKMSALNLGVFFLIKIEDLIARLLFETLGSELVDVDQTSPDWPKKLTQDNMKKIRAGLHRLHDSDKLGSDEFRAMLESITVPSADTHERIREYRHCVAHRVMPSVDYPELTPVFQDRIGTPVYGPDGGKIGQSWNLCNHPLRPDYTFEELYSSIVQYLAHTCGAFKQLKSLPRFA